MKSDYPKELIVFLHLDGGFSVYTSLKDLPQELNQERFGVYRLASEKLFQLTTERSLLPAPAEPAAGK